MTEEMKSLMAMNTFKSTLLNKEEHGEGFKFNGIVAYSTYGKTVTENLEVFLIVGGFEPMINLDIFELGNKITSEKYHMDFNPKFSSNTKFIFDEEENSLIIQGYNSPKIGDYKVIIKEAK